MWGKEWGLQITDPLCRIPSASVSITSIYIGHNDLGR